MILLSSVIQAFETTFLAQYKGQLLPSHKKALGAMKMCRTRHSRLMLARCGECDEQIYVPHSCGHRSCPHCQAHESQQWLERQLKKQVPGEHFLLTFTLPAQFRPLAWAHQRTIYDLMIKLSWETLNTFSHNDKQLQGTPGVIAVLHTHARNLDFHPHVHVVMPAAAIDKANNLWRSKKSGKKTPYLFSHTALAKVFRAKILAAITQAGLTLPAQHPGKWVVDCTSVGSGEKALIYLGRYLYRGVIREKDIIRCEKGNVTFRYQDSKTKQWVFKTVSGEKFLWRVLQHVLPKRFRRTRNFGLLHPNSKRLIQILQLLFGLDPNRALVWMKERPKMICRCCGGVMNIIKTRIPPGRVLAAMVPT